MGLDNEEIVNEEKMTEEFYEGEVVEVRARAKTVKIVLNATDEEMGKWIFALKRKVNVQFEA